MGLGSCIILLYLSSLHQVVKDGECHIRTQRTGAIAEQQGSMHRLANLTAFHNQGCLYAFAYRNQIMMYGRDGQQRRYCSMLFVNVAVSQHDIVHAIVHATLSLMAKVVECFPQAFFALLYIE